MEHDIYKILKNFEEDLRNIVGDNYIRYYDEEEERTYFLVTDEDLFWSYRDIIHEVDMKYYNYMQYYGVGYDIAGLRYDENILKLHKKFKGEDMSDIRCPFDVENKHGYRRCTYCRLWNKADSCCTIESIAISLRKISDACNYTGVKMNMMNGININIENE